MSFDFPFIPFERFDDKSDFLVQGSCQCESLDIIETVNSKRIDTLSICEMHNHADDYLDVGKCLSLTVVDTSIISVTAIIYNPNTISKIQQGVLTGFSIKFDSEQHHIIEIALTDAPIFQDDFKITNLENEIVEHKKPLSQRSTNDKPSAKALELFIKSVTHRRLLYLWMLRTRGYKVDAEEIARIEVEQYPDLQKLDGKDGGELSQRDVDELQLELSLVDPPPDTGSSFTKAILFQLKLTTLRMRKEGNHARPHFHIEYRDLYRASYAVDNFERLVGEIPLKYEKPILDWAVRHQKSLKLTWKKLQAGEDIRELVLAADEN